MRVDHEWLASLDALVAAETRARLGIWAGMFGEPKEE